MRARVAWAGVTALLAVAACDPGGSEAPDGSQPPLVDAVDDTDQAGGEGATDATTGADTGGGPDLGATHDGAPGDASVAPEDTQRAVGDPAVLVGAFQIALVQPVPATATSDAVPGFTSFLGKVFDGPTPDTTVWDLVSADGGCRLLTPRAPWCEGGCGPDACVEDGVCHPWPKARTVGTVQVSGVKGPDGKATLAIDPIGTSYQPTGGTLPYPAFGAGDPIIVAAAGSDLCGPFEAQASGVAPLELTSGPVGIVPGTPLALTWAAPGLTVGAMIHVKVDLSHHGGSKGLLLCEVEDTGALTVPLALSDGLVALGYSGFPTIVVTRRSTGSAVIPPGRVDVVVSSAVELPVSLPGLTSCTDDADCPPGEACQFDLKCQ